MARLADDIEALLKSMLEEQDGLLEFTRSELADTMNCVPSQITYVLRSRFTNQQGYVVESRRGGGGSIRIRRVSGATDASFLMHVVNALSSELSQQEATVILENLAADGHLDQRERTLMKAAVSAPALRALPRDTARILRSELLANMLCALATQLDK